MYSNCKFGPGVFDYTIIRETLFPCDVTDTFQNLNNLTIVNSSRKEFARFSLIVFFFLQKYFFSVHTEHGSLLFAAVFPRYSSYCTG